MPEVDDQAQDQEGKGERDDRPEAGSGRSEINDPLTRDDADAPQVGWGSQPSSSGAD